MSCGVPDYFGETPETDPEPGYVSAPHSRFETVKVRCPNCGGGHRMPMDGAVPTDDRGDIDWNALMPFIVRYAQGLGRRCAESVASAPQDRF